jgi:3(or 17)beta-hydroxysteroid dehydrogenase
LPPTWRAFSRCRSAIPAITRSGSGGEIINIASIAGSLATPFAVAYGASKAAVAHLTKSVAQYRATNKLDIRCNSIHPGMLRTAAYDAISRAEAEIAGIAVEELFRRQLAVVPLGAFIPLEDVAAAVAFLASDRGHHR